MDSIIQSFSTFWHVWLVGSFLVCISLGFLLKFVLPARRLGQALEKAIDELSAIKEGVDGNFVELSEIADGPMERTSDLKHSWREYAETLHQQKEVGDDGQSRIVCWRATALAETFFSEHAIVYTPLKVDFYKHLPGILTGIGIIGTFLGLIIGLSSFDVSDPSKAQEELKNLINAVGHAFWVSGAAIALAMVFTWIEKSMVTARNRQVAELRQLIDSLFDAGAGEEYLERLVRASETQATQAAHIKDALVADLKEILTTLTESQLERQSQHTERILHAQAEQTRRMSEGMGKAIAEHLGGPISDIAQAVKGVSTHQGDAVHKMLTDVLTGFSAQMQDMFGGQMRGMTELLKETSMAMRQSAEKFATLATDMDAAGKSTVEAMGKRLNTAITSMEARQQVMNKQVGEVVVQMREMLSESQTESTRKLQEALGLVGKQVVGVVNVLRQQAEAAAQSQGHRQERFEESTGKAVQTLSAQMEGLLAQSVQTNRSLQDAVVALSRATGEAIAGMNQGAETLYLAATNFAQAGQGVSDTMQSATAATDNIKTASVMLSTATNATKDLLSDYARTRDSFAMMVTELKSVMENARRDAAMTSEIIGRIESAAGKLGEAQRQSEEYLQGVNDVLAGAHESFAKHVGDTMRVANAGFQKELRTAVDMVSAAVRDLSDTLEDMPGRGR